MSVVFEKTSKCRYMYRIGVNNSLCLEQQTYYELLMYICAQEDQKQIHHLHSTRLRLGVPQQGVYTDIKKEKMLPLKFGFDWPRGFRGEDL